MTVINNPARNQYIATNLQTIFAYAFEISNQNNIQVYQRASGAEPDDVADILILGVDYTVTGVGVNTGGTIVLVSGATTGDIISLQGNAPPVRSTTFTPGGVIQAANLNTEFDDEILIYQTILGVQNFLVPKYSKSAIVDDVDLVLPILAENQFWAMNGNRTAIEAIDITSVVSGGTVTQINTGLGLTGGPITNAGTISFAEMPANTFWGNITAGVALPTQVTTSYFLQSANNLSDLTNDAVARTNLGVQIGTDVQPYSAALTSIAGLTTVSNDLIYTTASNTYAVLSPVDNRTLVTSGAGAISWSDMLPQAVQTNIQYLGIQNQNLNMGGFQINSGAEPTQPSDFATKNYVDLNALTGTSVYAATTTNLTVTQSGSGVGATLTNAGVQATFALDGVNPPVNSIVLIKDLANASHEGIYSVTNVGSGASNWILTRATTYDTPSEINQTGLIVVQNGSTLAGTAWYNAATIVTVDTTNFSYSQFGNITFPVSLAHGGTNANLTASTGGIFYSTATAGAILSGTATARQMVQSGASAAPAWSTTTWPATSTINRILYSSANNTISEISTVNSAGLLTNGSGVPAWVVATGTGAPVLGTSPTITAPTIVTGINDANGVPIMAFTATASAVNYFSFINNVTGAAPAFVAAGSDSNIDLQLNAKGTGNLNFFATGMNFYNQSTKLMFNMASVASAVNYIVSSNSATGIPLTLTATGTDANIYFNIVAKGSSGVVLTSNGASVINAANGASCVNYTTIQGAPTGGNVSFIASGTDSNVGMILAGKGTGGVTISSNSGSNPIVVFSQIASSVNYFTMQNNTTGNVPVIAATGSDANITIGLQGKGTGGVLIVGTSTNDNANAGAVGELLSASNLAASPIVFTTGVAKTLQSITLTPGDWDVFGNIFCVGTTVTSGQVGLHTTTNVMPDNSLTNYTGAAGIGAVGNPAPQRRVSVAANTTYYIVGIFTGTGTLNASGGIYARRRR